MPGDPTATLPPPDHVACGRLGRPHGLDGGLRLQLEPGFAAAAPSPGQELFVEGLGAARVRAVRDGGPTPVVFLEGVRDRDAAAALVHARVYLAPADAPAPGPGALAGAPVTLDGRVVGRVREAVLGGPNEFLRVDTEAGEVLLPLAAPYVRLEPDAGVVLVDPPTGLLDPA